MGGLLTGQLAYVFLVAILDAALISWITWAGIAGPSSG